MSARVRTPFALASACNLHLSREVVWIDCVLVPGETYRLRSLVEGTTTTANNAGLIRFEMAGGNIQGGKGLSTSPAVGPYMYLRSGPGLHRTDCFFSVVNPVHRIGLMAWGNRGRAVLKTLTLEKVDAAGPATDFFLSFDVEALPARAPANLIDSLVWGRIGGREYGIRRICDVLEQHRLKGNFLIDFASCSLEGEGALRRLVEFLAGRGHELHMHLHSERLMHSWGLRSNSGKSVYLDSTPYEMSRRMLDFTVSKYEQFVEKPPRVFRSGGYRMSPHLVLAAGSVGIEALSNVYGDMIGDPAVSGDVVADREPFVWDNGVLEIPVDVSSPEAGNFENYLRKYDIAIRRKTLERTFNIVMHSWSLTRRSAQGFQDAFEPEHERRLHQLCEHVTQNGVARGYGEYLNEQRLPRPEVKLAHIRIAEPERLVYVSSNDIVACNVCDAVFARTKMESDSCPGCGMRAPHRQLRHVLDNFGNVFDNRSVLAYKATPAERRAFLRGASQVIKVGPGLGFDRAEHEAVESLAAVEDASHDCLLGLFRLAEVMDDGDAVAEIARVLKPGGLFVSAVPDPVHATSEVGDATPAGHWTEQLSKEFVVSQIPGLDPVTNTSRRICLAYKQ